MNISWLFKAIQGKGFWGRKSVFLDPRNKGPNTSGSFRSLFRKKAMNRASKRILRVNFVLRKCGSNPCGSTDHSEAPPKLKPGQNMCELIEPPPLPSLRHDRKLASKDLHLFFAAWRSLPWRRLRTLRCSCRVCAGL